MRLNSEEINTQNYTGPDLHHIFKHCSLSMCRAPICVSAGTTFPSQNDFQLQTLSISEVNLHNTADPVFADAIKPE